MPQIKVAMLPLDTRQADPAANIAETIRLTRDLDNDTDILVLPELFSTGFIKEPEEAMRLAEPIDGHTIDSLTSLAHDKSVAVAGTFLCRDADGTLRNRAFFINPDTGIVTHYDKHHLFVLSNESHIFKAGDSLPPVVDFRGWHISITVCYDLRYPVWMRNTSNRYDMMIVPANWPNSRAYAWKSLLVARAIENQAVFIGVDRSGTDAFGTYSTDLTMGVGELGDIRECTRSGLIGYTTFSLGEINTLRHRFPVHLNADPFTLVKN